MERTNDHWLAQQIKEQGRLWVMQQHFWLFGTATYKDGSQVTSDDAQRNARRFFNKLDRSVLNRKQIAQGQRLPRLVFVEQGRLSANTHLHFFIKGFDLMHYRSIRSNAKQLWSSLINAAADIVMIDNITANSDRAGYCWKEVWA